MMNRLLPALIVMSVVLFSCESKVEVEQYNESGTQQLRLQQANDPGTQPGEVDKGDPVSLNPETGGQFVPPVYGALADPQPFHDLMHKQEATQVVDVRSAEKFADSRMDVARNVPIDASDFTTQLNEFGKQTVLLFYDDDGRLAEKAIRLAQQAGYSKVYGLKGGLAAWKLWDPSSHMVGGQVDAPIIETDGIQLENYMKMTLDEWHQTMHQIPNHQVLDVRSSEEYAQGYILESVHCDVDQPDFTNRILTLSQTVPILIYGSSAAEAAKAGKILQDQGYQVVYELLASYTDFANAGFGHLSTQGGQ